MLQRFDSRTCGRSLTNVSTRKWMMALLSPMIWVIRHDRGRGPSLASVGHRPPPPVVNPWRRGGWSITLASPIQYSRGARRSISWDRRYRTVHPAVLPEASRRGG